MKKVKTTMLILIGLFFTLTRGYASERFYVESDPFAFAFGGYSLHMGKSMGLVRAQVGVFSAYYPDLMKANKNFAVKMQGFGAKLDYTGGKSAGWFAGVSTSSTTLKYSLSGTSDSKSHDQLLLGIRAGYRFEFGQRYYAVPWFGMSRDLLNAPTITLSNQRYNESAWVPFATIHLGVKF